MGSRAVIGTESPKAVVQSEAVITAIPPIVATESPEAIRQTIQHLSPPSRQPAMLAGPTRVTGQQAKTPVKQQKRWCSSA